MATPLPGFWGRAAGARVDTLADTELANDVAPDADRVIAAPTPLDPSTKARLKRRALYLGTLAFGALAGLLGIAQVRWEP